MKKVCLSGKTNRDQIGLISVKTNLTIINLGLVDLMDMACTTVMILGARCSSLTNVEEELVAGAALKTTSSNIQNFAKMALFLLH